MTGFSGRNVPSIAQLLLVNGMFHGCAKHPLSIHYLLGTIYFLSVIRISNKSLTTWSDFLIRVLLVLNILHLTFTVLSVRLHKLSSYFMPLTLMLPNTQIAVNIQQTSYIVSFTEP